MRPPTTRCPSDVIAAGAAALCSPVACEYALGTGHSGGIARPSARGAPGWHPGARRAAYPPSQRGASLPFGAGPHAPAKMSTPFGHLMHSSRTRHDSTKSTSKVCVKRRTNAALGHSRGRMYRGSTAAANTQQQRAFGAREARCSCSSSRAASRGQPMVPEAHEVVQAAVDSLWARV